MSLTLSCHSVSSSTIVPSYNCHLTSVRLLSCLRAFVLSMPSDWNFLPPISAQLTLSLFCFLLLCNNLPQIQWHKYSFFRSGIQTWLRWILYSRSHEATTKVAVGCSFIRGSTGEDLLPSSLQLLQNSALLVIRLRPIHLLSIRSC